MCFWSRVGKCETEFSLHCIVHSTVKVTADLLVWNKANLLVWNNSNVSRILYDSINTPFR